MFAYHEPFALAIRILEILEIFPIKERYSLINQIRRSSRSVISNIAETYRKRKYPRHFYGKLTDSDAENKKTQTWFEFDDTCDYINSETFKELINKSEEIGKLLNYMILNPAKYGVSIKKIDH